MQQGFPLSSRVQGLNLQKIAGDKGRQAGILPLEISFQLGLCLVLIAAVITVQVAVVLTHGPWECVEGYLGQINLSLAVFEGAVDGDMTELLERPLG